MSVELTLTCTCSTGSGGTVQEIMERKMAPRLGMAEAEVHNFLDLFDRVLESLLHISPGGEGVEEVYRSLAERSGIPLARIEEICRVWDEESERADREGVGVRTGDHPRIPRTT